MLAILLAFIMPGQWPITGALNKRSVMKLATEFAIYKTVSTTERQPCQVLIRDKNVLMLILGEIDVDDYNSVVSRHHL